MAIVSELQKARKAYIPKLPKILEENGVALSIVEGDCPEPEADKEQIEELFPNTYGLPILTFEAGEKTETDPINVAVILSGGQAAGGHNVIAGIYDALKAINPKNRLFGFLNGPGGLIKNNYTELTQEMIDDHRNTGGFSIIGSGRDKLEKIEDFNTARDNCKALDITALVIIGGDDSNTNACVLAEYYQSIDAGIQVIGCPKTIDGDLKNQYIETSFGFDTACKIYSELIGNIQRDVLSSKKYWHFIKLMGRSASHIALEASLMTRPNITLISEEVEANCMTLEEVVNDICNVIANRAADGKNYGVILIPEGLIEFIPEIHGLIHELNELLAEGSEANPDAFTSAHSVEELVELQLTESSAKVYFSLPLGIKEQLVLDRDPHGNVKVSQIETERLLILMCEKRLEAMAAEDSYSGSFGSNYHFFGYEGRSADPSNFDSDYCYALGYTAAALISAGKTGYISSIRKLSRDVKDWVPGGVPVTSMMNVERRHGEDKPVIRKALVELDGPVFAEFVKHRDAWAQGDEYIFPGPIQFYGPSEICDTKTNTLKLESE